MLGGTYGHRGLCQSFQKCTFSQMRSAFHQIKSSLIPSPVALTMQTNFLHCLLGRAGRLLTHIKFAVPFKPSCSSWSGARSLPFCTWAGLYAASSCSLSGHGFCPIISACGRPLGIQILLSNFLALLSKSIALDNVISTFSLFK